MFIINFFDVPAGIPLLEICGLPFWMRGALEGSQNGFEKIFLLVRPEDSCSVINAVKNDGRLSGVRVLTSDDALHERLSLQQDKEQEEAIIVAGNGVWVASLLTDGRTTPCHGKTITWMDRKGDCIMVKMMATDFVKHCESHDKMTSFWTGKSAADSECHQLTDSVWYAVRSERDIRGAEDFLLARLVKKADGVVSRNINRKISLAITRRLMRTAVTPNQVTALVFLVGIMSGPVIVVLGGYGGLVAGALLYYAAAVLDGCDGELSRLRFQGTPYGAWLDTVVDDTVGLSYITGLYWYLSSLAGAWGWVGCTAIFFYLLTLGPRYYVMANFLGSGDYQKLSSLKPRTTGGGFAGVVRVLEDTVCRTDFIPFAAFVTALLHGSGIFAGLFMLGCIGSALDSIATFFSMRKMSELPHDHSLRRTDSEELHQ